MAITRRELLALGAAAVSSRVVDAWAAQPAVELKQGVVEANGISFHYLEAGKGPLALCLHGFPDSAWSYRYLLPELAKAGYRGVADHGADVWRADEGSGRDELPVCTDESGNV